MFFFIENPLWPRLNIYAMIIKIDAQKYRVINPSLLAKKESKILASGYRNTRKKIKLVFLLTDLNDILIVLIAYCRNKYGSFSPESCSQSIIEQGRSI